MWKHFSWVLRVPWQNGSEEGGLWVEHSGKAVRSKCNWINRQRKAFLVAEFRLTELKGGPSLACLGG